MSTMGSSVTIRRLRTRIGQAPWVCDLRGHTGTQSQTGPTLAFMPSYHVLKFSIILNKPPCVVPHWVPPVMQLILHIDQNKRSGLLFTNKTRTDQWGLLLKGILKDLKVVYTRIYFVMHP